MSDFTFEFYSKIHSVMKKSNNNKKKLKCLGPVSSLSQHCYLTGKRQHCSGPSPELVAKNRIQIKCVPTFNKYVSTAMLNFAKSFPWWNTDFSSYLPAAAGISKPHCALRTRLLELGPQYHLLAIIYSGKELSSFLSWCFPICFSCFAEINSF